MFTALYFLPLHYCMSDSTAHVPNELPTFTSSDEKNNN